MYELYYWPTIQGRGEFVRLALEEAGADYIDVARAGGEAGPDESALSRWLTDAGVDRPPFAPPFLKIGGRIIGQTANILLFLGERHGLAPADEAGRSWTHQLQLTIADLVAEIHDSHHPIAVELYYEDQRTEAQRRTKSLRETRLPKFLDYFDRVLARNPHGPLHLVSARLTYADLSLFQVIAGLRYAFPKAAARLERDRPRLSALALAVAERPNIAAYLASDRRLPFNQQGIFRYYAELDD